jgi:outer membrane protein assembly factor BamB
MNAPSQGRPSGIPVATQGSTRTIFLSSQDGHVYAFNAETGAAGWSPSSPFLAPAPHLQAHPSGVFGVFGGTRDLVFVGTRDPLGSKFYALRLLDGNTGGPGWTFNGGAFGKIGAINGQAAVDYQARRVYFASREFDSTNNKTLWCLDFETGATCAGFAPQAYENIDTSVSLSGGHLFVGSNNATGTNPRVRAIRTSDGGEDWSFPIPIPAEGAPKGYVVTDRLTGDSYFSTANMVWALNSSGGTKWAAPLPLITPSTPVFAPGDNFVYVGTGDGRLRRIRVAGGEDTTAPFPLRLGSGTAAAGSPTFDLPAGFLYVGTEDGIVYAVQLP